MSFDKAQFDKVFSSEYNAIHLPTVVNFERQQTDDEKFATYQGVFATGGDNGNNVLLDEKTMQNIVTKVTNEQVPVLRFHNRRDYPIGQIESATYEKKAERVTGTIQISRDSDTEPLIARIDNGTVDKLSPGVKGPIKCNMCDSVAYYYGGYGECAKGHELGQIVEVDGKAETVTFTMLDGQIEELSVVSFPAMDGAVIFEQNKDLLLAAHKAGHITDKVLSYISQTYSVNFKGGSNPMSIELIQYEISDDLSKVKANLELANGRIVDFDAALKQSQTDKEKVQTEFDTHKQNSVSKEDYAKVENDLSTEKAKVIEKESELTLANAKVSDLTASIAFAKQQAVHYYAKVRCVEETNTTDILFTQRKSAIEASESLPYLLGAMVQYMQDFYSQTTTFGGNAKQSEPESLGFNDLRGVV